MFLKRVFTVILAVPATVSATYYLRNPFSIWNQQECTSVYQDQNWSFLYADNIDLIGHRFKDIVVGQDEKKNKDWWKSSFNKYAEDRETRELSQFFLSSNINYAYEEKEITENTKSKALNKVCESIYKKKTTEFLIDFSSENKETLKLKSDFWTYCTPWKQIPDTIETYKTWYPENTFGDLYKEYLLSGYYKLFTWSIWKILDNDFQSLAQAPQDKYFAEHYKYVSRSFYDKITENPLEKKSINSLKKACLSAYEKKIDEKSTEKSLVPSVQALLKYCTLDGWTNPNQDFEYLIQKAEKRN